MYDVDAQYSPSPSMMARVRASTLPNGSLSKNIALAMSDLAVLPLVRQLRDAPELWDSCRLRTENPKSPHRDMQDIIVRYNDPNKYEFDREKFNDAHDALWWSPAIDLLPAVKPIVFDLMRQVEGERLGMVLITRLPAGSTCHPHRDTGWHAEYFHKYAVLLQSHLTSSFCFEDGARVRALPGEAWWFRNQCVHWVENPTPVDRLTMIVCIKPGRPY
jgi:hypothetical protein